MVLTNYHTKYSKSVIPNIPNSLYQIFQNHYTKYPKSVISNILNMKITKQNNIYRNIQISVKQKAIIR